MDDDDTDIDGDIGSDSAEDVTSRSDVASNDESDTSAPAGDQTIAQFRAMHDDAVATRRQALAAADRAAAAGLDPSGYLKIADEAHKEAYELNLKAIEYAQPETTDKITDYEYGQEHPGFEKPTTEIVNIGGGQWQTVNKATGEPIGAPVGHPSVAPRPVTDDERKYFGLPAEGAFTIAPGEVPKQITGAGTKDQPLPPGALDWLATRLNLGDTTAISNLGFGSAANRAAVVKRAAELATANGADAATAAREQIANQVQLGGDKQAGRTVGALGGRISTFAEEAAQTGELALQASEAVPRSKWVPINSILQMGEAAASDPELSRLQAANNEFATTFAKAANPSGIPTDALRDKAFQVLNVAKSPEAYEASVRQLQKGIRAIQSSVGTSRANIRNSVAGQQPQAPAASQAPVVPPSDVGKLAPGTQFMGTDGQLRVKH